MLKKTSVKLPLLILLSGPLYSFTLSSKADTILNSENIVPAQVSFTGTILLKMDGIQGILDAESISDCFKIVQKIIRLTNGILDQATGEHIGLFQFEGVTYTLKQLVVMEQRLIKNNVPKLDPEYIKFKHILSALKEIFQKEAAPLLAKTKKPAIRSMNEKLINLWIERANRHNSILRYFGTAEELAALERANGKEFFLFLNDLKCFLKDLMRNAPKACEMYKKECLKPENYQTFDDFLNS